MFSLFYDNKSKNESIFLKFGRDIAFLYLQTESVDQKNRSLLVDRDKIIFARSRIFKKASKNVRYNFSHRFKVRSLKDFQIFVFQKIFDKLT